MIQPEAETFVEQAPAPTGMEIVVPDGAILTSATDLRGVITYANPLFCELSGYDRQDLVDEPHRIIRHPDMPRGLFQLYWTRLKQNQPVAAYVKNQARDGRFYWVFALVVPVTDGYFSMRFKPRAPQFETIRDLYPELLKLEKDGATPEQSHANLITRINALGFADYSTFMRDALAGEYSSWCAATGKSMPPALEKIEAIKGLTDGITTLARDIDQGFRNIRGEPVNMRILAGRLDEAGAAIGTISQNYESMAEDMQQMIKAMECSENGALSRMRESIACSKFATLLSVAFRQARRQAESLEDDDSEFREFVTTLLRDHGQERMKDGLQAANQTAAVGKELETLCRQLRRRINGLDLVKLLCRVENGRIGRSDSGLQGIIDRLERFHNQTDSQLTDLAAKAVQILAISATLH